MARGGPEGAREALAAFWKAVSDSARFSPIQRSLLGQDDRATTASTIRRATCSWKGMSRLFSPYDLNPLGLNPLRDLLDEHGRLRRGERAARIVHVYVTATNVRTGRPRVFAQGEVTVDAVLASACLPQMFPAVEIDGEAYWDGGFTGNPALYPLIDQHGEPGHPGRADQPDRAPRPAADRARHHQPGERDQLQLQPGQGAARHRADAAAAPRPRGSTSGAYTHTYLHLIHAELEVQDLVASSKLNAEWGYLRKLFDRGRAWADAWLRQNFDRIGVESTLDLDATSRSTAPAGAPDGPAWRPNGRAARKSGQLRRDVTGWWHAADAGHVRRRCCRCLVLACCAPRGAITADPAAAPVGPCRRFSSPRAARR